MKQSGSLYRYFILFSLLLLASVSCVPTETEQGMDSLNQNLADVVTVETRDENSLPTASPIASTTPTKWPTPTSTPIPPDMITPTAVFTLIATRISTKAPPPAPTRTPTPAISPTPFATPENALTCHQGEEFTKCDDLILGIEFEYPKEWGNLTGYMYQAMSQVFDSEELSPSGYAYNYRFDQYEQMYVESGGRSREFSEGRGGILTDFSGFPTPQGLYFVCSWPYYRPNEICKEIQPNVVLLISITNSTEFCTSEFGRDIEAFAVVALEIPDNDLINGFIFGANILGTDVIEEVRHDFPQRQQPELICDDVTRQAFDERMAQLAEDFANMTITGQTLRNLEHFNHLAESITFK